MDEPIIYTRNKPIIYTRNKVARDGWKDQLSLYRRLFVAVANDEKDEFMTLIKDPGFEEVRDSFTADRIFNKDALEIAIAVFNGETKGLIDMEDVLKGEMTSLHLAVIHRAPRLTEYLLQRGEKVDATAFDFSTRIIFTGGSATVLDLLWRVCFHNRDTMEVIRMLVQSAQDKTWARHTFMEYARKGHLHKLAALFLAVPELFLSPPQFELSVLREHYEFGLDSWENKTFTKTQLPLLLDVFSFVGERLAAYIRLEEYAVNPSRTIEEIVRSKLEIDFFLREVAHKARNPGVTSPNDYYLRFFEVGELELADSATQRPFWINDDDKYDEHPVWDICISQFKGNNVFRLLPYFLARKDFERSQIYRLIPELPEHDADKLRYMLKGV